MSKIVYGKYSESDSALYEGIILGLQILSLDEKSLYKYLPKNVLMASYDGTEGFVESKSVLIVTYSFLCDLISPGKEWSYWNVPNEFPALDLDSKFSKLYSLVLKIINSEEIETVEVEDLITNGKINLKEDISYCKDLSTEILKDIGLFAKNEQPFKKWNEIAYYS